MSLRAAGSPKMFNGKEQMTPYQVVKMVEWAGTLKARKRLQKVVYLLQSAGCEALDAGFILHYYGPYSAEVASLTDQMTAAGLLEEAPAPNQVGIQYEYRITDRAKALVQQMETEPQGQAMLAQMKPYEQLARELLGEDLPLLEYGSTMVFLHRQLQDWDQARLKTCEFKKLEPESDIVRRALKLARKVVN